MILKQYYNRLAVYMDKKNQYSFVGYTGKTLNMFDVTSSNHTTALANSISLRQMMEKILSGSSAGNGVIFGDGNTPVAFDDYCLSGNRITNLTGLYNITSTITDNGRQLKCIYTLTNGDTNEVTINEVGLIAYFSASTNSIDYCGLIDRTVLDTPVTIPAGGVGQVEYTITFNYPV